MHRRARPMPPPRGGAASVVLVGSSTAATASPTAVASVAGSHPPAGMRWVGYGHEAIAVSVGWGTNVTRCGRPQRDTVLIDRGTVPACHAPPRGGVESVEVRRGS